LIPLPRPEVHALTLPLIDDARPPAMIVLDLADAQLDIRWHGSRQIMP